MWKQRIDNLPLFPAEWLKHQRRDAFWKHGSVCEDYDAIQCAVLAVGGWLDGYTPTIINLVENLKAPCKGLIGPWGHKEPHRGVPGPAIDFLRECKRWWDKWLKGIETGVEKDPDIRLYLMDYAKPAPHFLERKGRWLGFKDWPSRKIKTKAMYLSGTSLIERKPRAKSERRSVHSPQTTGMKAQEWCPYGQGRIAAEGATDQREDDSGSLCFDTAPLKSPLHIVGNGFARLRIAADRKQALAAVRICDVAPDGTSAMVSFGILNLAHRKSHEFPEPLKPGKFYDVVGAAEIRRPDDPEGPSPAPCRLLDLLADGVAVAGGRDADRRRREVAPRPAGPRLVRRPRRRQVRAAGFRAGCRRPPTSSRRWRSAPSSTRSRPRPRPS